jgi:hypothetical protein
VRKGFQKGEFPQAAKFLLLPSAERLSWAFSHLPFFVDLSEHRIASSWIILPGGQRGLPSGQTYFQGEFT